MLTVKLDRWQAQVTCQGKNWLATVLNRWGWVVHNLTAKTKNQAALKATAWMLNRLQPKNPN